METGHRDGGVKMRAVNYMKIDYILTKQQMRIMPLMVLVALLLGRTTEDVGVMMGCSYMIFVSTIFATAPFGSCHRKNTGFLLMLPATVTERVLGRFLYGLSFLAMSALVCVAGMGVCSLLGYEVNQVMMGLFLCNMALGMFIVALEYLISYIFGEGKNNWQYVGNLVRIAPGMAMYFLFMYILGKETDEPYVAARMAFQAQRTVSVGAVMLALSLLVWAAAIVVCVKVIERRDYA